MAPGSKASYTGKQKRQAEHIEEGYEKRGTSKDEAERRAWATVNKETGGGKKSGSGRGKKVSTASSKKGGKIGSAAKKKAAAGGSAAKTAKKARGATEKSTAARKTGTTASKVGSKSRKAVAKRS